MLQFFSRVRAIAHFKARSADRDVEVDRLRAEAVFRSIEHALQAARAEQAGLASRVEDVLARAALTLGNDTDEYLTREPEDSQRQNLLGAEIANGQRRLAELGQTIAHFQFLRTALLTRFPNFNLASSASSTPTRTTT
jgi:hypothetical protein